MYVYIYTHVSGAKRVFMLDQQKRSFIFRQRVRSHSRSINGLLLYEACARVHKWMRALTIGKYLYIQNACENTPTTNDCCQKSDGRMSYFYYSISFLYTCISKSFYLKEKKKKNFFHLFPSLFLPSSILIFTSLSLLFHLQQYIHMHTIYIIINSNNIYTFINIIYIFNSSRKKLNKRLCIFFQ